MKDLFEEKSKNWDKGDVQTSTAMSIANAIKSNFSLNKEMEILDFGVGTGLLGFEIAKYTKQVYGVDTSTAMLEKLEKKNSDELNIIAYNQDIIKNPLEKTFDGLISSMTLHHIEDLDAYFNTIYKNINKNGFIAIADLESEDGTFHSDNTGVFHFGFNKDELCSIVKKAGFKNVVFENITTIKKPKRDFGVFILTATL